MKNLTSTTSSVFPVFSVLVTVMVLLLTAAARAGGLDKKDFSLRFPAAMTRFASYADVAAAGGASAGSKWGTSINPAATAWLDIESKHRSSLCPQYTIMHFGEGTDFHVLAESLTVQTDRWGTLMPVAAQIETNRSRMTDGMDFRFKARLYQIQWAEKISEDWSVGANLNYARSTTRFDFTDISIAKSESEGYGLRLGVLHRLRPKLLGGMVLEYAGSRDKTLMYGIPLLGTSDRYVNDTTQQFLVRPGLSFEYKPDSLLLLDYQFGTFFNDTGRLQVHRFSAGIDHGITEWLYCRAGTTLDVEGNTALTCGLALYPTEWLSLDIAYQYDMFPEIEPEFGRSHTMTVSISFTF